MGEPVFITGAIMQYDWGRVGNSSLVASLSHKNTPYLIAAESTQRFAELWLGTHPKGVNHILPTETSMNLKTPDFSVKNISTLPSLKDITKNELSYLFKVLSIDSALSLQAHPDLELAQRLHKQDPVNYRDPNHKPELVIALTDMIVLCGFRSLPQIGYFLQTVPEFSSHVPTHAHILIEFLKHHDLLYPVEQNITPLHKIVNPPFSFNALQIPENDPILQRFLALSSDQKFQAESKKLLSDIFRESMTCEKNIVDKAIRSFQTRHSHKSSSSASLPSTCTLSDLVCRLGDQYPADVGVLCPFFLNFFSLKPAESVFLGPNIPHAYLSGQCMEAMACSDNVVRAGLTPKFRDVETLCTMLTYDMSIPVVTSGTATPSSASSSASSHRTLIYAPPLDFPEFMVLATCFSAKDAENFVSKETYSSYDSIQEFKMDFPTAESIYTLESDSILIAVEGSSILYVETTQQVIPYLLTQGRCLLLPQHIQAYAIPYVDPDSPTTTTKIYRCASNQKLL